MYARKRLGIALSLALVFQGLAAGNLNAASPTYAKPDPPAATLGNASEFAVNIEGNINEKSVDIAIARLKALSEKDPKRRIQIRINSMGGYVMQGYRLIDAVAGLPNPVDMVCRGNAQSMAGIIFIGHPKTKGERIVQGHCEIGLHAVFTTNDKGELVFFTDDPTLIKDREKFAGIIARVTGLTEVQALEYVPKDTRVFSLEEARKLKFFDRHIKDGKPMGKPASLQN